MQFIKSRTFNALPGLNKTKRTQGGREDVSRSSVPVGGKGTTLSSTPSNSQTPIRNRNVSSPSMGAQFVPTTFYTTQLSVNPSIPNPTKPGQDVFTANLPAVPEPADVAPISAPSTAIPSRFGVKLLIPGGTQVVLRCSSTCTVAEFKKLALLKTKNILAGRSRNTLALFTEEREQLNPDSLLADNLYIEKKLIIGEQPSLILSEPSNLANLLKDVPQSNPEMSYKNEKENEVLSPPVELNSEIIAATPKQVREFSIQFILPGAATRVLNCSETDTVGNLKERLVQEGYLQANRLDHYTFSLPENTTRGQHLDETTQLNSLHYIIDCRKRSTIPKLRLVELTRPLTNAEKRENKEIGALTSQPLCWTNQEDEITTFRKAMRRVRNSLRKANHEEVNKGSTKVTLVTRICDTEPPSNLGQLLIRLLLPLEGASNTKTFLAKDGGMETADAFLDRILKTPTFTKSTHYSTTVDENGQPLFVLKVQGIAEYIVGDIPLANFVSIRHCIVKNTRPKLVIVRRDAEENYYSSFNGTKTEGTEQANPSNEKEQDDDELVDLRYDHETIASERNPWDQRTYISLFEMTRQCRVRILGVERINESSEAFLKAAENKSVEEAKVALFVTVGLYYGGALLCPLRITRAVPCSSNPRWCEWIYFTLPFADLPRESRLCFTLYCRPMKSDDVTAWESDITELQEKDTALGWVNTNVFDYKHELRTGMQSFSLWPDGAANPIGTCVQNIASPNATQLFIEMDTFPLPVVFPTEPLNPTTWPKKDPDQLLHQPEAIQRLEKIFTKDPLYRLSDEEKNLVWELRGYCVFKANALPKFLQSVNYSDRFIVQEMHSLLAKFTPPQPIDALELLDSKYADAKVREYAVKCLENFNREELLDYLLQLVQVLKYEPYHDSALARFLLRRALEDTRVGHSFFWYLRSEMHVPEISERYGLLLEAYLRGCGVHREELKKQNNVLKSLELAANKIKDDAIKTDEERKEVLLNELRQIKFPPRFQLPLNPSLEAKGLILEKCKFMDSKKLPLWLVWQNNDNSGDDIYTIFKAGDDLRQDMLTLQMIRIMDKLWKKEGMDLLLSPYGCIATGSDVGMIEVVLNAQTTAAIAKESGYGAKAAFKEDPLKNWLVKNNPTKHQWDSVLNNFMLSCAGYCVATYVLGIGDRHNDNVMVIRDGRLFHIDFGHFLGNYKKKFGFKRERAPFVLTPDFAFVMGGRESESFKHFIDICIRAYNILRKHASMFINLFAMMLSTGIPELKCADDIEYLRDAFALDLDDDQAAARFTELIIAALDCWTTRFNNAIHLIAHG
jgi:hypothetical protein